MKSVTLHIETPEGDFYCFSTMCETTILRDLWCPIPFFYYFEDSGAPIGIYFLEMSTATGKIFPLAPCLRK